MIKYVLDNIIKNDYINIYNQTYNNGKLFYY